MTQGRDSSEWTTGKAIDLVAHEHVRYSYGRYGEDIWLLRLFGDERGGRYIGVDIADPRESSNTFLLHRFLGWRGINIAGSTAIAAAFQNQRPDDTTLCVPSDAKDGTDKSLRLRRIVDAVLDAIPDTRRIDLIDASAEAVGFGLAHLLAERNIRSRAILVQRSFGSPIQAAPAGEGYRLAAQSPESALYVEEALFAGITPATGAFIGTAVLKVADGARRLLTDTDLLRSQATTLKHELAEATAAEKKAQREIERLNDRMTAIESSRVWRIAGFVYKVKKEIRRFSRRVSERKANGKGKPVQFAPPPPPKNVDLGALKSAYDSSPLASEPDGFVLYRILGNDIVPRHRKGQTLDNATFILENEPELEACEKRWIVNRIVDRDAERAIVDLLERHGQPFLRIPFDLDVYARVEWAFENFPRPGFFLGKGFENLDPEARFRAEAEVRRFKNNYVMNNNGARNAALAEGRSLAKWVLPWDGNCYLTATAWAQIRDAVTTQPHLKYFVVPMARVGSNKSLLRDRRDPRADEEPQIIFRRDTEVAFDERYPYGRRPKVELLWRLGVQGPWDSWEFDPWDLARNGHEPDAGQHATAGWVARLESGQPRLESGKRAARRRSLARAEGVIAFLDDLDRAALLSRLDMTRLAYYDEDALEALAGRRSTDPLAGILRRNADEALSRGPYSVVDKTTLPPSGDPRDYWHPAPYWWPNSRTADGLPYVRRDGERRPGTELYEPDSDQFDRTRLQMLFDDTATLSLAWRVHGDRRYIDHAAALIRCWFLAPQTAMHPHLRFAQVRLGHESEGSGRGVIEFKDIYYFLDAVRLVEQSGALNEAERGELKGWIVKFRTWLQTSPQGHEQMLAANNHGTMFDVQSAAIGAYLGEPDLLSAVIRRARDRLPMQFEPDGTQPLELARSRSRHYCAFNLQAWATLARLAGGCGDDLWQYTSFDGRCLERGLRSFLTAMTSGTWPHPDMTTFDLGRLAPLVADFETHYSTLPEETTAALPRQPIYHPDFGIAPYWMLARR